MIECKKKVAIVILNWNGKFFLERHLPSVLKYSTEAEVFIIDNHSTDESIPFLKTNYPYIKLIQHGQNFGFCGGYNKGLKEINAEYYLLLNSDVDVTPNWLHPMLDLMEKDSKIGACQPKMKDYNNPTDFEYAGAAGGLIDKLGYPFCRGRIFETIEEDLLQFEDEKEIFWASGACFLIRSTLFHQLNGFDERFFAHMEEIDLCWRIQNLGYKIYYTSKSQVLHVGGGTLHKENPFKTFLNFRNSLLCIHNNLPSNIKYKIIFQRLILDGVAGIKFLFKGNFKNTFAIIKAHFSFYYLSFKTANPNFEKGKNNTYSKITERSIVYKYFILKKTKFLEL